MRILLLNWQDRLNPQAGGAETHLHEIFERLAARGHSVTLLASGWEGAAPRDRLDGIEVLIPTAQALGIDMVHFGVVVVVNIMLGLITPPYGLLLFIMTRIAATPMKALVADVMPFLVGLIIALAVFTFVPETVLWLPKMFGYVSPVVTP